MAECLLCLHQIMAEGLVDAMGKRLPHGMGAELPSQACGILGPFQDAIGLRAVNRLPLPLGLKQRGIWAMRTEHF
jgi:hypothetical protein